MGGLGISPAPLEVLAERLQHARVVRPQARRLAIRGRRVGATTSALEGQAESHVAAHVPRRAADRLAVRGGRLVVSALLQQRAGQGERRLRAASRRRRPHHRLGLRRPALATQHARECLVRQSILRPAPKHLSGRDLRALPVLQALQGPGELQARVRVIGAQSQ
jgi:hypothetical protein